MKSQFLALVALIAAFILIPEALSPPRPAQAVPSVTSIVASGVPLFGLPSPAEDFGPPGIHDSGQVAFVARGGTVCGLYRGDGSATPADMAVDGQSVPPFYGVLSLCSTMRERPPVVMGDGSVAFQGMVSSCPAPGIPPCKAIMLDPVAGLSPVLVLAVEGDLAPGGGTLQDPVLIDASTVCENAIDDDPLNDGLTPTVNDGCPAIGAAEVACADDIDDDGDAMVNDGCPPVAAAEMGNSLLFRDPVSGGPEGIFLATGPGSFAKVVAVGDPLPSLAGSGSVTALGETAMNDEGDVIWDAALSGHTGERGIFVGSSSSATLVVAANAPESGGACNDAVDSDSDGHINEGCLVQVSAESGAQCTEAPGSAVDDDSDGKVNDGCPQVGSYPEGGNSCNNALNDDVVDDGVTPRVNDGCPAYDPETDQCDDITAPANHDAYDDAYVNDGCVQVGSTSEGGTLCANNVNDDPSDDNVVNDGCPQQGSTSETDQCDNGVDEDADGGDGAGALGTDDGCPTGGDAWTQGASYSDPIVALSEPRITDGLGSDPQVMFRATTANGYSGYYSSPLGASPSPEKLVMTADPWYGGSAFQTLGLGGACENATDDDPTDDPVSTVNDGCPASGTAEAACADATDDDGDDLVNDGCPTVGSFAEGAFAQSQASTTSTGSLVVVGASPGKADKGIIVVPGFQKIVKKGESSPGGGLFSDFDRTTISKGGLVATIGAVTGVSCGFATCKLIGKADAQVFVSDKDGDGLSDAWETGGIDVNNDGVIDLNLPAMGADPDKKDVYIEVDFMDCGAPAEPDIDLNNGYSCTNDPALFHSHKPLGGMIEGGANGPINGVDSCTDGLDNDVPPDGLTDTADPDCSVVKGFQDSSAYNPTDQEDGAAGATCKDGIDNGGDTLPDRFDSDCQGIKLHVYVDERMAHTDFLDFPGASPSCFPGSGGQVVAGRQVVNFNNVKTKHFGTVAEQGNANKLKAKGQVFHYSIYSHRQDPNDGGSSGCGELPGNDFYVSLGAWSNQVGTVGEQEGTFMHELGHNLDLCHGGPASKASGDGQCDVNYKVNYLSVMNYTFQMPYVAADTANPKAVTGRPLDYSRWTLPPEEDGAGPGTCDDGIENGIDAAIDIKDGDCVLWEPSLAEPLGIDNANVITAEDGVTANTCADGLDNDGSTLKDAADPDCLIAGIAARNTAFTRFPREGTTTPVEDGAGPGSCADLADNGPDGLVDAADPDCGTYGTCVDTGVGGLRIDNDGDNRANAVPIPSADPDCRCPFTTVAAAGTKDWNSNGAIDGAAVLAPIKDPLRGSNMPCWLANSPGTQLKGYTDWLSLLYNFRTSQGYSDGVPRGALPPDQDQMVLPDSDSDNVPDSLDNCPSNANSTQDNNDADSMGDVCDPDDDNDKINDDAEGPCGGNSLDKNRRPERIDGAYAGVDDDGDLAIDEALPPGASAYDCDGDGYKGSAEDNVYSYKPQLTGDQKVCQEYDMAFPDPAQTVAKPSLRWPSDFATGGTPDSTNRINILDIVSFLAPIRYFNTNVGSHIADVRWDLAPGKGSPPLLTDINVYDLVALLAGSTAFPPMFGGTVRAFNGPPCPYAP